MVDKIKWLEIDALALDNMVTESEVMANTNSFNISWLGSSGVTNGAVVEQKNYDGKGLGIEVVVTGTPTWGVACVITVIPKNCELKSGKDKVEIAIDGANLGRTFLNYITPKSSYAGQTVKFAVTIVGAEGAIFYARGDIGSM